MATTGPAQAAPQVTLMEWADVAARLAVGRTTVFRLIRDGELEAVHLSPRMTRIRSDSVDRYIERVSSGAARVSRSVAIRTG